MMRHIVSALLLMSGIASSMARTCAVPDDSMFDSRIGMIDEFIKRFNAGTTPTDTAAGGVATIVNLFNVSNFSSESDPMYTAAAEFAAEAVSHGIKLSYTDSLWHANAVCEGNYKGRKVTFSLDLVVEPAGSGMYKWSIAEASGDLFRLTPSASGFGFKIMPDDHETNFMSLAEITGSQVDCITNYISADATIDPTTVFFTMVYDGSLKIGHVSSLSFIFNQVPGWSFTVRKFERESTNSGWLIDSVIKL